MFKRDFQDYVLQRERRGRDLRFISLDPLTCPS